MQLVVRARLHYVYKQSNGKELAVAKHCRQYLLAAIDGLHTAEECANLSVNDFPLLDDVALRMPLRRYVLNFLEDTDGSMGEESEDSDSSKTKETNTARQSSVTINIESDDQSTESDPESDDDLEDM